MRRFLIVFTMLMLSGVLAFAQTHTVSGTIKDDVGSPVPFATVIETGTKNATTADASGNFSIKMTGTGELRVTAAGFDAVSASPEGNLANVTLKRNTTELATVVVTALGVRTNKTKIGYATTSFNADQITRGAPANALDALAGKIPGASISKTGGPGSSTKVVIRGYGVIGGGNNQPLYVIDGVPLNDARPGSINDDGTNNDNIDFGNGLNDINPNDIENITILKGTAAASLYGSTAKNGAVMITTKRGKSGKIRVDYNGSVNFSEVGKLPTFQNKFGQGWNSTFIASENGSWGQD